MRSSLRRFLLALTSMFLALPSFAWADQGVWLTPGGSVTWIPNELGSEEERPVFGGIVGLALSPSWSLEGREHYVASIKELSPSSMKWLLHGEGNLSWFLAPGRRLIPYVTAGAGAVHFEEQTGGSRTRFAWNGGAGFTVGFSERTRLRADVRDLSYKLEVPSGGEERKHSAETFVGISFGFGGTPSDADADGVPDKLDRCPDTAAGARVDATGCPIDSDGDGIADGFDRCGGTPVGAVVDATGCPTDEDRDGVLDGVDACAGTPAGARVDTRGCPTDSDRDGVPDGLDACEGTLQGCVTNPNGCPTDADQDGVCDGLDRCGDTPASARVDQSGCPIVVSRKETELLETGMIRLQNVNFETGKSILKPESYPALDEIGSILDRWPELKIEIAGHTDSRGSDAFNQELSEARARTVLEYLTSRFPKLSASQFSSVGYGEAQPLTSNSTPLGMAKNRRVEFRVLNTEVLRREREERKLAPKD